MTRKGSSPIKLWFDTPEEMVILSNKRQAIQDLFKLMENNSGIGRIDTLELFAAIVISTQGKWESMMQNMMMIFGFGAEGEFSRDEFHFFLDCLFRGLLKLLIVKPPQIKYSKKRLEPLNPGKRLSNSDIEKCVAQIFPNNIDIIERTGILELMQEPLKDIS